MVPSSTAPATCQKTFLGRAPPVRPTRTALLLASHTGDRATAHLARLYVLTRVRRSADARCDADVFYAGQAGAGGRGGGAGKETNIPPSTEIAQSLADSRIFKCLSGSGRVVEASVKIR